MKTLTRASLLLALTLLVLAVCAGAAAAAQPTVSGTVKDAVSGKGVVGVTVRACNEDTMPGFSWATDTARDGSWSMMLWNGTWKIRYDRYLYVTQWYDGAADEASADALSLNGNTVTGVDVSLARTPQGHLQGTVTDAKTGLPVADADVEATSTTGHSEKYGHALTEADGTYDLAMPPGTYTVRYLKFGYSDRWYDGQTSSNAASVLTVTDGMLVTGKNVALPRTPMAVAGTVKDVDYNDLQGIQIQLLDPDDAHVLATATTDAGGYYSLDTGDFVGQSVKVRCHDPNGQLQDRYFLVNWSSTTDPAKAELLEVKLGISQQWDLWLSAAQQGHVTGHTLNSSGQVVPDVPVRVETRYQVKETQSDANGAYSVDLDVGTATSVKVTFSPLYSSGYAGEVYNHRVIGQDGDWVPVAAGQTVTVDSALTRPCSIGGTVSGSDGNGFSWVRAQLYDQAGDLAAETLGFNGDYSFTGLREGTYRLFVPGGPSYRDQYYSGAASLADATTINLTSAHPNFTADMTMVRTGDIGVAVWAEASDNTGIAGAMVRLYGADGGQVATATTDSNGTAAFTHLEMGTYYVGCDAVGDRYLGAFSGGAMSLEDAAPIALTGSVPYGSVGLQLVSRRGTPVWGMALPDGGWSDSTSLVAVPTAVVAADGIAVAGDGWDNSARVFTRGDDGWTFAALLKPTSTSGDAFGRHMAVSGDTIAISDYWESGAHQDGAGKVWVYRRTGSTWALEQVLKPTGATYRSFGAAVALDGDTLLVGAPEVTVGDQKLAGAVFAYTRTGTTWTQRDKITCDDVNLDDSFGRSVALQGSTAVISAPRKDWGGHNCGGEVFVFTGSGADWKQRAAIKPSDGLLVLDFGEVVAFDSGTIAIGCSASPEAGAIYVYTGAGSSWSQQARLTPTDGSVGWSLGTNLALEGDTILAVAATDSDAATPQYAAGTGYLFRRSGTAWHQDAELRAPYHGDRFWSLGWSVAVSGDDLLIGAPSEPRGATNDYGWLHVFHPYVTGLGQELTVPRSSGVLANDSSPTGADITAALAIGPSHGSLALSADGSFSYTPAQGWAGDDTFTYTATDGTWTSDPATVTVTTRDPNAPNVAAEDVPEGWVNQPVTVTLAASDDTQVREIDYRRHRAKPVAWTAYDKPFVVSAQGATEYQLRALDVFGNASHVATVTVKVDTKLPVPKIPKPCAVAHGRTAAIRYLIADPRPGSPTANVEIQVLRSGKELWNAMLPGRLVGKLLTCSYRCNLPKGVYTLQVTAIDAAGNAAKKPAKSTLTVH